MIRKAIFNLVKEILNIKEEPKRKSEVEKYIEYKAGELYVINVCALYFTSNKEILLTSSEKKLLNETKGLKYRPIVIVKTDLPNIYVFALSTNKYYKTTSKRTEFDNFRCNFITKDCFLPELEDRAFIFEFNINRKRKNAVKITPKNIFPVPLSVLRNLSRLETSPYKKQVVEKCNINENYKVIKKCANCDKHYLKELIKKL